MQIARETNVCNLRDERRVTIFEHPTLMIV